MGLFSKKKKTFAIAGWGEFALVFSNGNNRIWSLEKNGLRYVVRGSDDAPYQEQVDFLSTVNTAIEQAGQKITARFISEFKEAGMSIDFVNWKERFRVTSIEVMDPTGNDDQWNIYFEDLKRSNNRFTVFMQGQNIIRFSMDD